MKGKISNKLNVLRIDDDTSFFDLYEGVLDSKDFNIVTAKHGKEGFKKFKKYLPFLTVTDMNMPQMGGIELIELIKSKYPNAMVLMITGTGSEKTEKKAKKVGAYEVWDKPFNIFKFKKFVYTHAKKRLKWHHKILEKSLEIIRKRSDELHDFLENESHYCNVLEKLKANKRIFQWIEIYLLQSESFPKKFDNHVEKYVERLMKGVYKKVA